MTETDTSTGHAPASTLPTLKISGAAYTFGDIMMMAAGLARNGGKHMFGTVSGSALWLSGGLAAAHFGNPNTEKQLHIQATKLERYLQEKGVKIPLEARSRSTLLKHKTLWEKVEEFCYEHPSELLNSAYAIGAGMVATEGVRELSKGKTLLPKAFSIESIKGVSSHFWIGAIVLTGALIGLLVKEDPNAKEKAKHGSFFEKAKAFITEKPLWLTGALYTVNNAFLGLQAWQDFGARHTDYTNHRMKPHYASTLQLASYLLGNGMLMASHRNPMSKEGMPPAAIEQLQQAATHIIAAQSPQLQQALLIDISAYLANEKGMNMDAAAIHAQLASKLAVARASHLPKETAPVQKIGKHAEEIIARREAGLGVQTGLAH